MCNLSNPADRITGPLTALIALTALGCGSSRSVTPAAPVSYPLPVTTMLGVEVVIYPLTRVLADRALDWDQLLEPRTEALRSADSLILAVLTARTPEVIWVPPEALRRAARQAPNLLVNPDRMGTAVLRNDLSRVPDPLRSQMRSLTGIAGDRMALVPASLFFFSDSSGLGRAELTVVLVDVRLGEVRWRSVASGSGASPWDALREALDTLAPVSP